VGAIAGGVVSTTVILKVLLAEFPATSVAETATVVSPGSKVEPEAGQAVGVIAPSNTSLALISELKSTTTPPGPVGTTIMSVGPVISGVVRLLICRGGKLVGSDVNLLDEVPESREGDAINKRLYSFFAG
jgi:hypothetical protein